MDSNGEAVAGNGAVWEPAMAHSDEGAITGDGAFWEDDRRSPIAAFGFESDPIGSGAQPTTAATNATSANGLPKREACHMR